MSGVLDWLFGRSQKIPNGVRREYNRVRAHHKAGDDEFFVIQKENDEDLDNAIKVIAKEVRDAQGCK